MNKEELVAAIAERARLTKKDAGKALDALVDTVKDTLARGEEVKLIGFGKFKIKQRKAKQGRNPQTGETIPIPAANIPAFEPGKDLKSAVPA